MQNVAFFRHIYKWIPPQTYSYLQCNYTFFVLLVKRKITTHKKHSYKIRFYTHFHARLSAKLDAISITFQHENIRSCMCYKKAKNTCTTKHFAFITFWSYEVMWQSVMSPLLQRSQCWVGICHCSWMLFMYKENLFTLVCLHSLWFFWKRLYIPYLYKIISIKSFR